MAANLPTYDQKRIPVGGARLFIGAIGTTPSTDIGALDPDAGVTVTIMREYGEVRQGMPSLPIHRSRRLKPAANFFVAVPHSTNSPVGRKPRRAMMKSRVTPYLPPCMPPALQAMFPPTVQYSFDDGSGG